MKKWMAVIVLLVVAGFSVYAFLPGEESSSASLNPEPANAEPTDDQIKQADLLMDVEAILDSHGVKEEWMDLGFYWVPSLNEINIHKKKNLSDDQKEQVQAVLTALEEEFGSKLEVKEVDYSFNELVDFQNEISEKYLGTANIKATSADPRVNKVFVIAEKSIDPQIKDELTSAYKDVVEVQIVEDIGGNDE